MRGEQNRMKPTAPLFLDMILPNGDTLYVNLFAVASITIPEDANADAIVKMQDGTSFPVVDSHDRLLDLMNETSHSLGLRDGLPPDTPVVTFTEEEMKI